MEIKTAKQCEGAKGSLPHLQLRGGQIYRLISGGPMDDYHGKYYIACTTSGSIRATGAVSLKTGYRLDGLFGGTTWEEVKGHVCLEE